MDLTLKTKRPIVKIHEDIVLNNTPKVIRRFRGFFVVFFLGGGGDLDIKQPDGESCPYCGGKDTQKKKMKTLNPNLTPTVFDHLIILKK